MGSLPSLLEGRQWAQLVKALDAALPDAGGDRRQLLLNRAFCYQQLGLLRKAVKVGAGNVWANVLPSLFSSSSACSEGRSAPLVTARSPRGGGAPPPPPLPPPPRCLCAPPSALLRYPGNPASCCCQSQDYEAVLADEPAHPGALLHKAKALVALRQCEVRRGGVTAAPLAVAAGRRCAWLPMLSAAARRPQGAVKAAFLDPATTGCSAVPAPIASHHPRLLAAPPSLHLPLQEAQACLEQLAEAASLSADLAVLLEGRLLAAALAKGEVRDGDKLPLLPALAPPAPPAATASAGTQTAAQAASKQGLAAGFLGAAPKAAAAKAAATGEAAAAPATPAASAGSPASPQAAGAAAPAVQQAAGAAAVRQDGGGAARTRPSRPSRAAAAAGSRPLQPEVPVDPLHQLVARTDANQGPRLPAGWLAPLALFVLLLPARSHCAASLPAACAAVPAGGQAHKHVAAGPPTIPPPGQLHLCHPALAAGVGLAVQMVNTGQCREAVALLDLLLQVRCLFSHFLCCVRLLVQRPAGMCACALRPSQLGMGSR